MTLKLPCTATLLCTIHPDMEAFVLVVPTPYFALTDDSGTYAIRDLPDGTYTVKAWHPDYREAVQRFTVSGRSTLDFRLSRQP